MDEFAAQRFFGILALVALAGAVGLVLARLLRARLVPAEALAESFGAHRLEAAWLVAAVATAGSLYFSEVAHYRPCHLCWAQRVFMYPLVLVLGAPVLGGHLGRSAAGHPALGRVERWTAGALPWLRRIVIVWVLVGCGVSIYHYLLEWFPKQLDTNVCDVAVPCSAFPFRLWHFLTLPFMAGCGFLFIASVLSLPPETRRSPS